MADRADFGIDLEPAPERRPVERAEQPVERPLHARRGDGIVRRHGRARTDHDKRGDDDTDGPLHCAFSIGCSAAADGPPAPPSTGSAMLVGSGRGVSMMDKSGIRIRKCAK